MASFFYFSSNLVVWMKCGSWLSSSLTVVAIGITTLLQGSFAFNTAVKPLSLSFNRRHSSSSPFGLIRFGSVTTTTTTTTTTTSSTFTTLRNSCPSSLKNTSNKMATSTELNMAPTQGGLEQQKDQRQRGGMTLYCKAGPDGVSIGDCPFAHYVRLVLHEKDLDYDLRPCTADTKPQWLIDHYQGKMPALRHRQECYIESDVIAEYLDFFFPSEPLPMSPAKSNSNNDGEWQKAVQAIDGFFPTVAKYLKHTPDGDEEDLQLKSNVQAALQKLEQHFIAAQQQPPSALTIRSPDDLEENLFLYGRHMTLLDCSLIPKLYHLQTGVDGFKQQPQQQQQDGAANSINLEQEFPMVYTYWTHMKARPSFQETLYPPETVLWGWGNARK